MSDASATFAQSGQCSRFPRAYQLLVISAGSELSPVTSTGLVRRQNHA
jgi:hypothetical protein